MAWYIWLAAGVFIGVVGTAILANRKPEWFAQVQKTVGTATAKVEAAVAEAKK